MAKKVCYYTLQWWAAAHKSHDILYSTLPITIEPIRPSNVSFFICPQNGLSMRNMSPKFSYSSYIV